MKTTSFLTVCITLLGSGIASANDSVSDNAAASQEQPKASAELNTTEFNAGQYYDSGAAKDPFSTPVKKEEEKSKRSKKQKQEDTYKG